MAETLLRVTNIVAGYVKDLPILKQVSIEVKEASLTLIIGPNGAGKSTFIKAIAGVVPVTSGKITLTGHDITGIRPDQMSQHSIAYVPQSDNIFRTLSVRQNLELVLRKDRAAPDRIDTLFMRFPILKTKQAEKAGTLSGGQRQRVALARSLAKKPKVLLLDKPMGALDKKLRSQMQLEVVDIIEAVGVTCVMVTHDQEEAMTMADRISVMHEGEIMQVGTPSEIYEFPNSRHTAEFIGSVNIFDAMVTQLEPDYTRLSCTDLTSPIQVEAGINAPIGASLGIAVRPEKITMTRVKPEQADNWLMGVVEDIAYLGGHSVYYVKLTSGKRVMSIGTNNDRHEQKVTWQDTVYLHWSNTAAVVLYQ
jgi:putrescine transport system ATP-binding protein